MKIVARGAESIIYIENNQIVKERIKKNYRISEIDLKLRKYRTRSETKLLEKAPVNKPSLFYSSDKDMKIKMELIDGKLLRDITDSLNKKQLKQYYTKIGQQIALLHDSDIIHGDLTTSNLILKNDKIYFIDFGLGFFSNKIEDKAVDLHLLKQALQSKHYKVYEDCFKYILDGYKQNKNYDEVLKRLEVVGNRGRYKKKSLKQKGI